MSERPENRRDATRLTPSDVRGSDVKGSDARGVAFAVLNRYRETSSFVAPLLDEYSTATGLSTADRGLASELVHSVVRRQATLDALIEPCVSRPRSRVEPELWTLLQLGTCQLVLMSSIPPHAAVNETVEVARRYGKGNWTGMLNGVLRSVGRDLTDETVENPAADAVPLTGGLYRKLTGPVFPEPAADFTGYISLGFSFPRWLTQRWVTRFDEQEVRRLAFWFNASAKLYLRVNRLRTDRDAVLATFSEAGIVASAGTIPDSICLDERMRIDRLPGLDAGWFMVQDESAMTAVDLLDPRPGETVLDLCAAPGTKTCQLAERMQDNGRIIATDVDPDRLRRVEENCQRLGISMVTPQLIDRDGAQIPRGPFDAILVDAPCSNTGVLGKRPEARWRLRPRDIAELSALQQRLLAAACDRLKPAGRIVYSTCSIEPEENRDVVKSVLESRPNVRQISEREYIPGQPADGGYQVLIRAD